MQVGDLVSDQYYGIGIVTEIEYRGPFMPASLEWMYRVQFKKYNVVCFDGDLKVLNESW